MIEAPEIVDVVNEIRPRARLVPRHALPKVFAVGVVWPLVKDNKRMRVNMMCQKKYLSEENFCN